MLRIGLFSETFMPVIDGVGRVVNAYARILSQMGHQVTVAAPMADTAHRENHPFQFVDWKSFQVPRAKQYRIGMAALDRNYTKRMGTIKMDIVHAHSPFSSGSAALRAARRMNVPLVYTFHSKFYDDFYVATKSAALARLAANYVVRFARRCDEVWAVSEPAARLIGDYGFSGPVRVMPNGVDIRTADPLAAGLAAKRFGLEDAPYLLYTGQLDWKKNLLLILRAAALLKKQGISFNLVFAGRGNDRDAVVHQANELGLADRLIIAGHLTDVDILDGLYQGASLFVFPSLYDTAGLVVREAAVMGTPSVLIKGSDAAEGITDGYNGYLCADDPRDLCRVLADALAQPEKTAQIGRQAGETLPWPGVASCRTWSGSMRGSLMPVSAVSSANRRSLVSVSILNIASNRQTYRHRLMRLADLRPPQARWKRRPSRS